MKTSRESKVGLVQMRMSDDAGKNLEKATRLIHEASNRGAQFVCLPELFDVRYFPQLEESSIAPETIPGHTTEVLSKAAKEARVILVGGSIYEKRGDKRFNTSVVFDEEGRILGKYRKVQVPNDPSFYEQKYFDPGNEYNVFNTKYGRIGVLICFDQWYPEPARILKLMGAEMIFYPTAIGHVKGIDEVEGDWHNAWERVQVGHAISNSVAVAAVNRVGKEGEMTFWGGSFLSDQFGNVSARAENKEGVTVGNFDPNLGRQIEEGWGFIRNRKPQTYSRLLK